MGGQDGLQTAPDLAVSKGSVLFARPEDIRRAVEHALTRGQDKKVMAAKPGEIMGYLATGIRSLMATGAPSCSRMACSRSAPDSALIGRPPKKPNTCLR